MALGLVLPLMQYELFLSLQLPGVAPRGEAGVYRRRRSAGS